jgi:hypothetical protein
MATSQTKCVRLNFTKFPLFSDVLFSICALQPWLVITPAYSLVACSSIWQAPDVMIDRDEPRFSEASREVLGAGLRRPLFNNAYRTDKLHLPIGRKRRLQSFRAMILQPLPSALAAARW